MAPVNESSLRTWSQRECKNGTLIINALTKLKDVTGWTAQDIAKFIQSDFGSTGLDGTIILQTLRRGVELGLIEVHSRRYRLSIAYNKRHDKEIDKGKRSRKRKSGRSKSRSGNRNRRGKSGGRRRSRRH